MCPLLLLHVIIIMYFTGLSSLLVKILYQGSHTPLFRLNFFYHMSATPSFRGTLYHGSPTHLSSKPFYQGSSTPPLAKPLYHGSSAPPIAKPLYHGSSTPPSAKPLYHGSSTPPSGFALASWVPFCWMSILVL